MVRVRHYTRVSSVRKILTDQRIIARDRGRVFVELADGKRLPPVMVVQKYQLGLGKGNACVEFDTEPERLELTYNQRLKFEEYSISGDVDLKDRDAVAVFNF